TSKSTSKGLQSNSKFPLFLERGGQGGEFESFRRNSSLTLLSREKGASHSFEERHKGTSE
ncbi:MAG TPA: hypothetical protein VF941_08440, partial [Clostridia bacterium]